MPKVPEPVKLKHGTQSKLARRFKVTVQHVSQIAKAEREGREPLVAAILREAERFELQKAS